jgi:hypothetical protein
MADTRVPTGRSGRQPLAKAELVAEPSRPRPAEALFELGQADEVVPRGQSMTAVAAHRSDRHNRQVSAMRRDAIRAAAQMEEAAYRLASRPGDPEGAALIRAAERRLNTVLGRLDTLELSVQLDRAGTERPARHAIEDADGHDLRPDPLTAHNTAELVDALRRYRIWAGEPSFREMAANSRQRAAASTMCSALLDEESLPTPEVIEAVVIGCGGGQQDLQAFMTAWRRIRFKKEDAGAKPSLRMLPSPGRTA